jgi:hypothetical protein
VLRASGVQEQRQCVRAPVPGRQRADASSINLPVLHHETAAAENNSTSHNWGKSVRADGAACCSASVSKPHTSALPSSG